MLTWQDAVVAAVAPLVLWLLWRIQAVAVNQVLRGGMYRLLRYQQRTYNVVSWFGVLLHEISHAALLLIGGHGIRGFKVSVDSGHVVPKQVRRGPFGTLTFIAAALAPMYAAPLAVFLLLFFGPGSDWSPVAAAGEGFGTAWANVQNTAFGIPLLLFGDVVGLDIIAPIGAALFLLAVFAMPSARPSHVKKRGEPDEGDIAVVRKTIRRHPVPVLVVVGLAYASYFALVPFWPTVYWNIWQVMWTVSMLATVLAVLMGLVWYAVAWAGRITPLLAWIPFALLVGVQVAGRLMDQPLPYVNLATLAAFALSAAGLRAVATRRF